MPGRAPAAPHRSRRARSASGGPAVNFILQGFHEAMRLLFTRDSDTYEIALRSLQVSAAALAVSLVPGAPAGVAISLTRFPGRRLLVAVVNTGGGRTAGDTHPSRCLPTVPGRRPARRERPEPGAVRKKGGGPSGPPSQTMVRRAVATACGASNAPHLVSQSMSRASFPRRFRPSHTGLA